MQTQVRYYPPALFSPGEVVHNSYEVVRYLGIGASGMVYQCRHRELNNYLVAMKVFFSPSIGSVDDLERFKRELLVAYRVSHANVVRCYDLILSPELIAFTMEFIGGGSLADKIARFGPQPIERVVDILAATCSGLAAIHEAGIIHRDLKPANILLTTEGNIKITDFGIARMASGGRMSPRGILGTVEYVSPEYCQSGEIDQRSDLYSLGVVAYELLSGRVPFRGDAPAQTICMKIDRDALPIQNYRRDCPDVLAEIVHKALSRRPGDRYQSAQAMFEDLRKLQLRLHRDKHLSVADEADDADEARADEMELIKSRVLPPKRRGAPARRYRKFGGAAQGVNHRMLHVFATLSLMAWVCTVAFWIYSGRYATLFGDGPSVSSADSDTDSVAYRIRRAPERMVEHQTF